MRKVELLAPAGSYEALQKAIAAGCDAVYLGGSGFGARAYAKNFANEKIVEAIKYAHLYDVKIYVTINTLIYDHEFNECIQYINFLYCHDVDAIIVQDLGLMKYVVTHFPDLEIHASTQMTIHNIEGVRFLEENNIKRVVLARENSLKDIKKITQLTNIEIEVFVHGALCVCYSGQCLMSGLIGGRSGNRGRCAQPCRKLYSLTYENEVLDEGKYMLSPKDLNTVENIGEIIESNVHSLKIEGRMKSPEYVAIVVSQYRKAIDQYYLTKNVNINKKDLNDLAQIFNRQFTKGFMFQAKGNDFINLEKNNNSGVLCGKVLDSYDNVVKIKLSNNLNKNDGIYFKNTSYGMKVSKLYINNKEVITAHIGDIVSLPVKNTINKGDSVYKTVDIELIEKAKGMTTQRIPLIAVVDLFVNKKPRLTLVDQIGNKIIKSIDFVVEKSKGQPISEEQIRKQLNKLGNTPFYFSELTINKDQDIFIVIGKLNQLRRDSLEEMIKIREKKHNRKKQNITYQFEQPSSKLVNDCSTLSVYCHTLDQVRAARTCNIAYIYVNQDILDQLDNKSHLYLTNPRVNYEYNEENEITGYVVSDIGGLHLFKNDIRETISNFSLNVTNSETIKLLQDYGINTVTLSYEMNDMTYESLSIKDKNNLEIIIYGFQEAMITKHCLFANDCQNQCLKGYFTLTDEKKEKFLVYMDNNCHMHILNSKKLILSEEIYSLLFYGYRRFRLQFTLEDYYETKRIIDAYQQFIYNHNKISLLNIVEENKQNSKYTRGYYNKDIL